MNKWIIWPMCSYMSFPKNKKDRLSAQIEGCSVVFSYIFTLGCLEILGTAKGCLG